MSNESNIYQGQKTNTLVIFGFVLSFFIPLAGLVLAIVGLFQIKNKHEGGKGLAIAAIIISSIVMVFQLVIAVALIQGPSANPETMSTQTTEKVEKPKKWTKVVSLSGNANKRSGSFTLTGAEARMKYSQTGGEYSGVSVYIVDKGTSLEEEGGFAEVTADGTTEDVTMLAKSAGEYYLDVASNSGTWTVTIEELK